MYSPTFAGDRALKISLSRSVKLAIGLRNSLQFYERSRIGPFTLFLLELPAFVHENLPIIGKCDCIPFQRPRRRAFEVNARFVITAAVAGTLELLFCFQPIWRAAQVRAHG